MTAADKERWNERHRRNDSLVEPELPAVFDQHHAVFAAAESAIELACGAGRASVWLALHGVAVTGYDVSPVAVHQASALADARSVSSTCHFEVADLDAGLPPGESVGLILCHLFRDGRLDEAMVERLEPGGVLAIAVLSEVGAESGRFRAKPGELTSAFDSLEMIDGAEVNGVAWLVARKP